jgi:hypothetical protein
LRNHKIGFKKKFNKFSYRPSLKSSLLKRGFIYSNSLGQKPVKNNNYLSLLLFIAKYLVLIRWCIVTKKFINIRINKLLKFFTIQKNSDIKLLAKVVKP